MRSLRFGFVLGLAAAAGCGRSAPFGFAEGADDGEAGTHDAAGSGGAGAGTGGSNQGLAGGDGSGTGGSGAAAGGAGAGTGGSGVSGGDGRVTGGSGGQAGPAPEGVPALRVPRNGVGTGSVFAMRSLTPAFAWTPVDGATEYEIEIDDSCPVSMFDGCGFPSPERRERVSGVRYAVLEPLPVSRVAPVGTRYFWRVRACSGACGEWSSVRYVDVGRQRQDLDGDGYADVWLSPSVLGPGTLDVYFGPPPFLRRITLRVAPEASGRDDNFGASAEAVGDVNLDGYSDLVVGAARSPTEETFASAFLFFGGSELAQGSPAYVGWDSPASLGFGSSIVAVGDVNADGGSDFAVGGAWTPQPFSLFLGGATMPAPRHELWPDASQAALVPVSGGDLDGDGYSDLLAVEWDLLGYHHMRGVLGAGDPSQFERLTLGMLVAGSDEHAAAIGDTNGDGFVERAAFEPNFTGEAPVIHVTHGSPDLSGQRTRWNTGVMEEESVGVWPSARNVVNVGDVNADGLDDTAVEIRLDYSALIDVALFLGGERPRESADLVYRIEGTEPLYVSAGSARAAGDTNGDGFDDLLIVSDWDELARLFLGDATPDGLIDHVLSP